VAVCKPLADNAAKRFRRTLCVVHAKSGALAIAEAELAKIARQMFFADMMVCAYDAAFQDREETFDGVGMYAVALVFALLVRNGIVLVVASAETRRVVVVRINLRSGGGVLADDLGQVRAVDLGDMERAGFAAALDKGEHGSLADATATGVLAPGGVLVLLLSSYIGFVNFDRGAFSPKRSQAAIGHRGAETHGHEPCGLECHAQNTVKLVAADAFLAAAHQVRCLEPDMQRNRAILENGAFPHRELAPAVVALP